MLGSTLRSVIKPSENKLLPQKLHFNNRAKLLKNCEKFNKNSLILIKGQPSINIHDSDMEFKVYPEANFLYLFGVTEVDCYGVLDIHTCKSSLFIPKLPIDLKLWMIVFGIAEFKAKYPDIDEIYYIDDFEHYLDSRKPEVIYLYDGIDSDSGMHPKIPDFDFLKKFALNKEELYDVLNNCRVLKSQDEIKLMNDITKISSEAMRSVMKFARPGLKEFQLYALFKSHHELNYDICFYAFEGISTSGRNCSILHNLDSSKTIEDGVLVLCDMGAFYNNYCSDITITFPSNGKFTEKQKLIYNAVLSANRAVHAAAKPGVKWDDMHLLAEKTILNHLIKIGIVKDAPMEELIEKRVGAVFFPHGLGHLIGIRVHDVGGYSNGQPIRSPCAGLNKLRTKRVLEENMAITIEPGCYFVDFLIHKSYDDPIIAPYLNKTKINEFMEVGGVRIEDDVIITKDGCINLVDVPRTVEEIESFMKEL